MEKDFKVEIIGITDNPELLSTAGALGCFEKRSSGQILKELKNLARDKQDERVKVVLKESFGRGHGSVGDQNLFIFCIENLPRLVTLQLCLPEYLAHLQQSLRRAQADRGFYISKAIKESEYWKETEDLLDSAFDLYERMCKAGVSGEDARYILPLATKTNIQTAGNIRELTHLWKMSQGKYVPLVVKAVVNEMITKSKEIAPYLFEDMGHNYETLAFNPSAQLYYNDSDKIMRRIISGKNLRGPKLMDSSGGKIFPKDVIQKITLKAVKERKEEFLAALKHLHFEFLVPMSLACLHQAIRQRTWNHYIESIYGAINRATRMMPSTIKDSDFTNEFLNQQERMFVLQRKLEGKLPSAETIGVIPHSLIIYTLIHINGWNAIHSIGKRTCTKAQWEIRQNAIEIAQEIDNLMPWLGVWTKPQCIAYGYCPERYSCKYFSGNE